MLKTACDYNSHESIVGNAALGVPKRQTTKTNIIIVDNNIMIKPQLFAHRQFNVERNAEGGVPYRMLRQIIGNDVTWADDIISAHKKFL